MDMNGLILLWEIALRDKDILNTQVNTKPTKQSALIHQLYFNVRTILVLRRHREWGAVLAKQLQQSMLDDALLPLLLP